MVFVSIGKVCELLGISLSTAYRWIKSGKLKSEFRVLAIIEDLIFLTLNILLFLLLTIIINEQSFIPEFLLMTRRMT